MDCWKILTSDENLRVSYRRAKHALENFEGLVDHQEIADWENDFDRHLDEVRALLLGEFAGVPCNLTPVPKAEGKARAYYSIPLKYQVGWLAIVEAIGPLLDKRMPNWSFAYRLNRPRIRTLEGTWPWDEHRTCGDEIYLGFARSWKPFRRYANLTLDRFFGEIHSDDPAAEEILQIEQKLQEDGSIPAPQAHIDRDLRTKRFPYFSQSWPQRKVSKVWFARLDIKNFFPSIRRNTLPDKLITELSKLRGFRNPNRWRTLFQRWLNFIENPSNLSADTLMDQRIGHGGLPVGLIASGFLANVFMLSIDRQLEHLLHEKIHARVAILRYVDDFIVLTGSQRELTYWLKDFMAILREQELRLNYDKARPEVLQPIIEKLSAEPQWSPNEANLRQLISEKDLQSWQEKGTVTRFDRKEFISTTLQRMSFRAAEDPDMLDESELDYRFLDLLDLAAAGTTNAEVRQETLHAFSAGQLQRTPLFSPAPFLATTRAAKGGNEEHSQVLIEERIWGRGRSAVHQLLVAVTSAPHKHRLIVRCVQVATELAQFLTEDSNKLKQLSDTFRSFLRLLSAGADTDDPLTWHLGEEDFQPLRPALLSFLRMRFWNAVSDELLGALRGLWFLLDAKPTDDKNRLVPHRAERLKRKLAWLQSHSRWLDSVQPDIMRSVGFVGEMESGARARWRQLDMIVEIYLSGQDSPLTIQRASATPPHSVQQGQLLLMWSGPIQKGPLASYAKHALKTWVAASLRARTRWTPGEHRLIREWLLQDPQRRLDNGQILQRLIEEQGLWPVTWRHHSPATCKWIRELLWSYAALPNSENYFSVLKRMKFQSLNGCDIKNIIYDIERGGRAAQTAQAPVETDWLCSLQCLMELELWGTGRLKDRSQETILDSQEALRILLLVSLLKWTQENAGAGTCISLDNLFVSYSSFLKARNKIKEGQVPQLPLKIQYRLILRDYFFEVDQEAPDTDKAVVAGLVGIQLLAGPRALDHVLRRRPRRQIDAQDVLLAFEDAPAVSREVVGIVAALCMFPRWQKIRTNASIANTYETLLSVKPLRHFEDAIAFASSALAKSGTNCTRRDGNATYLISPGVGQAMEDNEKLLPEWLKVGLIQPNLELKADTTWPYRANVLRMSEDFAEHHAWPAIWHGLRSVRAGMRAPTAHRHALPPPAVIVIPELTVPRRRIANLKRFSQRENVIIVAGVEYRSGPGWARNEAVVVIPAVDRIQTSSARCFWVGKRYPAPAEQEFLKKCKGLRFVTSQDLTAINTQQTGSFGVSICYDLYAVQTFVGFQNKILHLFVAAYNRDIQTFDGLGDAAMRLLFCNVVIANGGTYGGSVAVSPYYDPHQREVLRIRGQEVDASENFRLPLQPLRAAQRGEDPIRRRSPRDKGQRRFKSRPADWPT